LPGLYAFGFSFNGPFLRFGKGLRYAPARTDHGIKQATNNDIRPVLTGGELFDGAAVCACPLG
jgi:hypothetical protein